MGRFVASEASAVIEEIAVPASLAHIIPKHEVLRNLEDETNPFQR